MDLVFQSIAGTQAANASFGVTLEMLREAREAALGLGRGTVGQNVMYFETGQGTELSADAHHGVDQQTLEARTYGVARAFDPLLVNSVVGFIGPEYLADGRQIIRAGLEDHFCGKLLGLPLGVDVCYTNHADADPDDMDVLLTLLANAGVTFVMGVPGADDVMLGYQSTSFHDALYVRELLGLGRAPASPPGRTSSSPWPTPAPGTPSTLPWTSMRWWMTSGRPGSWGCGSRARRGESPSTSSVRTSGNASTRRAPGGSRALPGPGTPSRPIVARISRASSATGSPQRRRPQGPQPIRARIRRLISPAHAQRPRARSWGRRREAWGAPHPVERVNPAGERRRRRGLRRGGR